MATTIGFEPIPQESKSCVLTDYTKSQYIKGSTESLTNLPLKKEMYSIISFYNGIVHRLIALLSRTFENFLIFFKKGIDKTYTEWYNAIKIYRVVYENKPKGR